MSQRAALQARTGTSHVGSSPRKLPTIAPAGRYRSTFREPGGKQPGHGEALDPKTRIFMEPRFGYDFSAVRVHKDAASAQSARALNASAFTIGSDIFLADAISADTSLAGRQLFAHELGHVVQQDRASSSGSLKIDPDSKLESQASSVGDRVARGDAAGAISPLHSVGIQRADDGEPLSLGILDNVWVDRALGVAVGNGSVWPFAKEALRGIAEGIANAPPERKQRLVHKFYELQNNMGAKLECAEGCRVGVGEGVWDSLKGIADLLLLGPRVCIKAIQWFRASGPSILKNFDKYAADAAALESAFQDVVAGAGSTLWKFLQHPTEAAEHLYAALNAMKATGLQKAREAGHSLAGKAFEFMEQKWYDIGESVGKLLGIALFEVLLAVATEGIANALKTVAVEFARGGQVVATKAVQIFRWLGEAVEGFSTLLRQAGSAVAEAFAEFIRPLTKLIERFKRLIAEAVEGFEAAATPELAVPGGGKVPPNVLMNEGKAAEKGTGALSPSSKGGGGVAEAPSGKVTPKPAAKLTKWGWPGGKAWHDAANELSKGGTFEKIFGKVPSREEAVSLLEQIEATVERIEGPHGPPNPHNFPHINYTTASGLKGTVRIEGL